MNKKIFFSVAGFFAAGVSLLAQGGSTFEWKPSRTAGLWYDVGNWNTTDTAVRADGHYIIAGPDNVVVRTGTNVANGWNFYSLTIGANAQNVTIAPNTDRSYTLGDGPVVIMRQGGITVGTGATATINNRVSYYNAVDVTHMNFDIQGTGSLVLNNYLTLGTRTLIKTGAGLLTLNASGGTVSSGSAFNFAEGTVHVGSGFTESSAATSVSIGSASTSATLRGSGSFASAARTFGISHSTIDMTYGALSLASVDASSGVTFRFDLDSLNALSGSDTLTLGEHVAFELSGGSEGIVYTLFDYTSIVVAPEDFASWTMTPGYVLDATFGTGGWQLSGGDLQFRLAAIPEPSTVLLGLAGVTMLGFARYRAGRRAA